MTDLTAAAHEVIARGWAVFPCMPRSKAPATRNGLNAATKDTAQVNEWWRENPSYNPAINLGASNLTVLDIDTGLNSFEQSQFVANRYPKTFTVRTGRRPDWGLQLYFSGLTKNRPYTTKDLAKSLESFLSATDQEAFAKISGEIRSTGYYVMAPGAIHDKSGETYKILRDLPTAPIPSQIIELAERKIPKPTAGATEKVSASFRHYYLTARAVELFMSGLSGDGLIQALNWLYDNRCERDAAKDAKVKAGELVSVAQWAERNITPGLFREDTQLVARLLVDDPEWRRAWEGDVTDVAAAFEYLVQRLFAQGAEVKPWQAERICRASPLHRRMEKE